jgi:hypothetical protein
MTHSFKNVLTGALLLSMASGCSTPNRWAEHREMLDIGLADFEAKNYEQTVAAMDNLLVATNSREDRDMFALQRYFATSLTVRSHMQASFTGAFLAEDRTSGKTRISFGASGNPSGVASPIGHLAATNFHAGFLLSSYEEAATKSLTSNSEEGETQLLPDKLQAFGIVNSQGNMILSLIAVHSRLQFQESVNTIVSGSRALQSYNSCTQMIADAQLTNSVKAWVYRGIFGYMETIPGRDHEAFKFAISALETARSAPNSMSASDLEPLSDWIVNNSTYTFICPRDGSPVDPDLGLCLDCSHSYLDFTPTRKSSPGEMEE